MCMGILPESMSVYHMHGWLLQRPKESMGSLGTGYIFVVTVRITVLFKSYSNLILDRYQPNYTQLIKDIKENIKLLILNILKIQFLDISLHSIPFVKYN